MQMRESDFKAYEMSLVQIVSLAKRVKIDLEADVRDGVGISADMQAVLYMLRANALDEVMGIQSALREMEANK